MLHSLLNYESNGPRFHVVHVSMVHVLHVSMFYMFPCSTFLLNVDLCCWMLGLSELERWKRKELQLWMGLDLLRPQCWCIGCLNYAVVHVFFNVFTAEDWKKINIWRWLLWFLAADWSKVDFCFNVPCGEWMQKATACYFSWFLIRSEVKVTEYFQLIFSFNFNSLKRQAFFMYFLLKLHNIPGNCYNWPN